MGFGGATREGGVGGVETFFNFHNEMQIPSPSKIYFIRFCFANHVVDTSDGDA